ncbi:MAG: hypothetical protein WC824_09310 [Bacteroidota bacterium]
MARNRRIDIFFILYLTAIVGFIVVSKERDKSDDEMHELNNQIARTFVPPVPLAAESDTLICFVDADVNGIVIGTPVIFQTRVLVHDIGPDDAISLTLHSVIHNGTLTTPDMVALGTRTGMGSIEDNTVYFPVSCVFPRTGMYHVNLSARADRVHETEPGLFFYHGIRFDTTIVSREIIDAVESSGITLTVMVEDTSIDRTTSLQELRAEAERVSIASAVGFEERNRVTVNLGWANPVVSIVRGGGRLKEVSRTDRSLEYQWSSTVGTLPDTVEIEARTRRQAGGKDVARARFAVSGVLPFLLSAPPEQLFAGEDISVDLSVEGLNDSQQYSWRLYEEVRPGDELLKTEGRGPRVTYRIPNSYAGKRLSVDARYNGRPYRLLSRISYMSGSSRLVLPVIEPPTRIELVLPERALASESFHFSASKYNDIRFRGEQPVDRLAEVSVEVTNEEGRELETDVWMIRKGEFEFSLVNRTAIRKGGERVIVKILAGRSAEQRSIHLR